MTDVCPFTLGTEVAKQIGPNQYESGYFQPIIERNTVIPASRVEPYSTLHENQTTGDTKQLILEGNPGSLSQAEIAKRLKELDKLKIHPRDVAENAAIVNRLKAAYENHLGDIRRAIENNLVQFEAVLSKQKGLFQTAQSHAARG